MTPRRQLTDAVLQTATALDEGGYVVPPDLARQFLALKARRDQEPPRDPEDELAAALAGELGPYMQRVAEQIVNGQQPDTRDMDERILVLLLLGLAGAAATQAHRYATAVGVPLDVDRVNAAAREWARQYGYDMVRGVNETTRRAISDAMRQFQSTPGMTRDDVARMLEPVFGTNRANMIATTEITRAHTQAVNIAGQELQRDGITTTRQWVTYRDDRVCPICAPLHATSEDVWTIEQPAGPPAHVNCRCWLQLVRV